MSLQTPTIPYQSVTVRFPRLLGSYLKAGIERMAFDFGGREAGSIATDSELIIAFEFPFASAEGAFRKVLSDAYSLQITEPDGVSYGV